MKDCEHTFRPKVGFAVTDTYFCMWCGLEVEKAQLASLEGQSKQIYF